MAKPLSEKSLLIRAALAANPGVGNTALAALLNAAAERKTDKLTVSAADVNNQRQAMKAAAVLASGDAEQAQPKHEGNGTPKHRKRRRGHRTKAAAVLAAAPLATAAPAPKQLDAVEAIDNVRLLAEQVGGMGRLRQLVERLDS